MKTTRGWWQSLTLGLLAFALRFPYLSQPHAVVFDETYYVKDAYSLLVNGFCKQVFKELPMEFAVEAKKLLEVSLEGSVG